MANGPESSTVVLDQIRPCRSLVKTSASVMSGTTDSSAMLRRLAHSSLPVYPAANPNHVSGTSTMPG